MSPMARLAEREELWSNILYVIFQRLSVTFYLMDQWRMADSPRYPGGAGARPGTRPSICTLSSRNVKA
jgi:hypothetical protein